jgi:glutamine amidotransferase
VIIDYGHGNANSIKNVLATLGVQSVYSSQRADIAGASALILPGVGHHGSAIRSLEERGVLVNYPDKEALRSFREIRAE